MPGAKTEKGLRFLEEGQRALNRRDFGDCIAANRRAIKLLADWPPPHNNLSLALFFDGQPDEAIATARRVLAQHPDNIQALSNTIRFLTWTGQEPEARALWARLQKLTPQNESNRLKMAEDEDRMQALFNLAQAGEIAQDETLRVWNQGEWRETQIRQMEISDEHEAPYTQEVADLLNQGLAAHQQNDDEQAERLFRRAIKLEPRAKEAYNNLGAIYARRDDHAQAQEMFRAAAEIDPLYVFPRCNLAAYLLDDDDVKGAQAMLAPLAEVTRFHPQDMAFYSYTQARVLMRMEEYDAARRALETALEVWPDHELSKRLLERLDTYGLIMKNFQAFADRRLERDQAWRARSQAKLSTADPSLSEALSLYTKDALTGMARVILPWDSWSGLRKAELLERIVKGLQNTYNLEGIVAGLEDEERTALQRVLAQGGRIPWEDFDAAYGNDLQESRYWNYHEPETLMGRLRLRGLLVEATVEGELLVVVPSELRQGLWITLVQPRAYLRLVAILFSCMSPRLNSSRLTSRNSTLRPPALTRSPHSTPSFTSLGMNKRCFCATSPPGCARRACW